ncbi:MAG: hypothetical protein ACFFEK_10560 [Candidatus Thorarchaeota archaeon]
MSQNDQGSLVSCAFGIMLLMLSLTCAVFVGTSHLTDLGYIPSTVNGVALLLIFSSLIGGYFTSYGFLRILRDSYGRKSPTEE